MLYAKVIALTLIYIYFNRFCDKFLRKYIFSPFLSQADIQNNFIKTFRRKFFWFVLLECVKSHWYIRALIYCIHFHSNPFVLSFVLKREGTMNVMIFLFEDSLQIKTVLKLSEMVNNVHINGHESGQEWWGV